MSRLLNVSRYHEISAQLLDDVILKQQIKLARKLYDKILHMEFDDDDALFYFNNFKWFCDTVTALIAEYTYRFNKPTRYFSEPLYQPTLARTGPDLTDRWPIYQDRARAIMSACQRYLHGNKPKWTKRAIPWYLVGIISSEDYV